MELLMIEGKTLKDQENPIGIITEDRKEGIEEAVKSGQLVHLVKGVKNKEKVSDTQLDERKKGVKDATPVDSPILMIRRESYNPRKRPVEVNNDEVGEITFPPLHDISSAYPVIIKAYVSGRQVNMVYLDGGSSCEITLWSKNTGATYQRLIDKVFNHQLGRNIEVNAEDIVIKSNVEEEMLADIKETLDGLRVINLKLNLKKCSFGVEEGIFSRHLITKQGIKASPSKVKAVSDLQPPKTVSEIQNLNRKLAALNHFLSKGEDKTLPFMRTLKSCTSGKMVRWTKKADEAFRRMKKLLEALPTMAERGKKQVPVYFVSRTLHGAELEYLELERLILALVYASRRLRRYFQPHPIQSTRSNSEEEIQLRDRYWPTS
ncbi:reverse transcriptase domain-containing protein [Tanacetum coccineum]